MKDLERNDIIFGAAYYPEYMPYERLQEDIAMMQEAGMNTVRICRVDMEHFGTGRGEIRFFLC